MISVASTSFVCPVAVPFLLIVTGCSYLLPFLRFSCYLFVFHTQTKYYSRNLLRIRWCPNFTNRMQLYCFRWPGCQSWAPLFVFRDPKLMATLQIVITNKLFVCKFFECTIYSTIVTHCINFHHIHLRSQITSYAAFQNIASLSEVSPSCHDWHFTTIHTTTIFWIFRDEISRK